MFRGTRHRQRSAVRARWYSTSQAWYEYSYHGTKGAMFKLSLAMGPRATRVKLLAVVGGAGSWELCDSEEMLGVSCLAWVPVFGVKVFSYSSKLYFLFLCFFPCLSPSTVLSETREQPLLRLHCRSYKWHNYLSLQAGLQHTDKRIKRIKGRKI